MERFFAGNSGNIDFSFRILAHTKKEEKYGIRKTEARFK